MRRANFFPSHILTPARLEATLAPERLERLRHAVEALSTDSPHPAIRYRAGRGRHGLGEAQADLVFSHVVMNQIEDAEPVYARCAGWLRPGGWMSHQIDLTSLHTTPEWNGHRRYGELTWKLISGRRPYFVNREPLGAHVTMMERAGFEIVHVIRGLRDDGIRREEHAPRYRGFSDEDLATQTGFVIARRRG